MKTRPPSWRGVSRARSGNTPLTWSLKSRTLLTSCARLPTWWKSWPRWRQTKTRWTRGKKNNRPRVRAGSILIAMPSLHETAYPRLRSQVSLRELAETYTPTAEELALADTVTRGAVARLGFLVSFKTFQRLGYFVAITEVPAALVAHIAKSAGLTLTSPAVAGYEQSGTRWRHMQIIRRHLRVQPYGRAAQRLVLHSMQEAARVKEDLADLIN